MRISKDQQSTTHYQNNLQEFLLKKNMNLPSSFFSLPALLSVLFKSSLTV